MTYVTPYLEHSWPDLVLLSSSPPLLDLPLSLLNLPLKLSHLLQSLGLRLGILCSPLDLLSLGFAMELVRATLGDVTRAVIAEESLEDLLDDEAGDVVDDHDGRHLGLKLIGEGDQLHLFVDLRDEFHGTGEGKAGDTDDAVEHAFVLGKRLAEGAALIVDGEGGDLLDELEEVDGGIEKGRREFSFEIDVVGPAIHVS